MQTQHKGSEFNNIIETWEQNEKNRVRDDSVNDEAPRNELEEVIKQEASEYDNENKENRILSGDRATVNDDDDPTQ